MTGSSSPFFASSVRSRPNARKPGVLISLLSPSYEDSQPRFQAVRSSGPILLEFRFAFVRDQLPDSLIPVRRLPHLPARVPAKGVRYLRKYDVTLGPLYLLMPKPF